MQGINFKVAGKRALAAAQIFISLVIILTSYHKYNAAARDRDFLLIPLFMILFAIIDSGASPLGKFFRFGDKVSKFLADYSLALYVSHWTVATIFIPQMMPDSPSYFQRIGPFIFCSLVYALFILALGRKIFRLGGCLKKFLIVEQKRQ